MIAFAATLSIAVASLLVATVTGVFGNEAHAWAARLAPRLIKRAARWRPADEQQDYEDENLDLVLSYVEDGLKLTALLVALGEVRRSGLAFALPNWFLDPERDRPERLVFGLAFGLGVGLVGGLGVGLVFGLGVGLFYGMFFWRAFGLFEGLGLGLVHGLVVGLGAGLVFWLVNGGIGLVVVLGLGLFFGLAETQGRWVPPLAMSLRRLLQPTE